MPSPILLGATPSPYSSMLKAELIELAESLGLEVDNTMTKAEIIELIEERNNEQDS